MFTTMTRTVEGSSTKLPFSFILSGHVKILQTYTDYVIANSQSSDEWKIALNEKALPNCETSTDS